MKIPLNRLMWLKRFNRLFFEKLLENKYIKDWQKIDMIGAPPHAVKRKMIDEYRIKHNCDILVETGTYLGDMIYFNLDKFKKIFSIELSENLANMSKNIFKNKKHVKILIGDSGIKLKEVILELDSKSLFWLDGHYSGGLTAKGESNCPVLKELDIIFNNNIYRHIILIDDANAFDGKNDYPNKEEIENIATQNNYNYFIKNNSFILEPKD